MFSAQKKNYLEWSMHVLLILGIKSKTIKTWLFSEDISPLSSYLFIYLFFIIIKFFLYYFSFIQYNIFPP